MMVERQEPLLAVDLLLAVDGHLHEEDVARLQAYMNNLPEENQADPGTDQEDKTM
jgi:hypothetical protein